MRLLLLSLPLAPPPGGWLCSLNIPLSQETDLQVCIKAQTATEKRGGGRADPQLQKSLPRKEENQILREENSLLLQRGGGGGLRGGPLHGLDGLGAFFI